MQVSLADQQKQQQLSQKRIWISSALGYFIPIASYIYTQRWQPLLWFAGGVMTSSVLIEIVFPVNTAEDAFRRGRDLSPLVAVIAIADNWRAIRRARKQQAGDDLATDR
jgi:hypothetical protein